MSDQELNPYAAPQTELSRSPATIPVAQEVYQRNLFPEVSTKDLERVTSASLSISGLDTCYILPGIIYAVFWLLLALLSYNKQDWDMFKAYSFWAVFILPSTTYTLLVTQRYPWSRYMGLIIDSILILVLFGLGIFAMFFSIYATLKAFGIAFFPARTFQARYLYPVLYGLDRVEHKDLLQELAYRRTHLID